jgi:hypothetical protein
MMLRIMVPALLLVAALICGCAAGRDAAALQVLGPANGLCVAVVVSAQDRQGQPIDANLLDAAVTRTEERMAEIFGGFTTLKGTRGGYKPKNTSRVEIVREEHAAIVMAYGAAAHARAMLESAKTLAKRLAIELNQESVAVVVNGKMHFVAAD